MTAILLVRRPVVTGYGFDLSLAGRPALAGALLRDA